MQKKGKSQKRRANGAGSLYSLKDGKWRFRITIDGKQKDFNSSSKAEVIRKKEEYCKKHVFPSTSDQFQRVALWWCNHIKYDQLSPSSFRTLKDILEHYIIPTIGNLPFSLVDTITIQMKVINPLYKKGTSFSILKKVRMALHNLYEFYIGTELVQINPVKAVVLSNANCSKKVESRILTDLEKSVFKQACLARHKNGNPIYALGAGFVLMLNTGIKLNEALALKWNDVDFGCKVLRVHSKMSVQRTILQKEKIVIDEALVPEEYPEGTPGNRVLELTETALTALKYIKEERYMGTDGYILAAVSGGATINIVYKATFRSILKRAGILPTGIMILSNTFVMRQLRAGIDPKYLSIWMGYASVQSFQKAYATLIKAWESESEISKSICNI